jgi:DNA-binding NarL/FixJ family response regulator
LRPTASFARARRSIARENAARAGGARLEYSSSVQPSGETLPSPHVVLVVEPHTSVRERVVQALAERYCVYAAATADAALELLLAIEPVVIVCGVALGELDGATFVRRARETVAGRRASFVALADHAFPIDVIHAIQAGVRQCIEAERDPSSVLRAVDRFDV